MRYLLALGWVIAAVLFVVVVVFLVGTIAKLGMVVLMIWEAIFGPIGLRKEVQVHP